MKRNILIVITGLFFAMGAYKAWEEQYEKAISAGLAAVADLLQTHEYQKRLDSLSDDSLVNMAKELHSLHKTNSSQVMPVIAQNALPDGIIAMTQPPQIVSVPQIANTDLQKQFETNTIETGDIGTELAKLKAEKINEKLTKIKSQTARAEESWTNNLQIFDYAVDELKQILHDEARIQRDGISITPGFSRCLPTTASHSPQDVKVAEISFQTQTNMDFNIVLTGELWLNKEDLMEMNRVRISCSCGNLEIGQIGPVGYGNLSVRVQIPDLNDYKTIPRPLTQESRNVVKHSIMLLVAGQIDYLSQTNKSH